MGQFENYEDLEVSPGIEVLSYHGIMGKDSYV